MDTSAVSSAASSVVETVTNADLLAKLNELSAIGQVAVYALFVIAGVIVGCAVVKALHYLWRA